MCISSITSKYLEEKKEYSLKLLTLKRQGVEELMNNIDQRKYAKVMIQYFLVRLYGKIIQKL